MRRGRIAFSLATIVLAVGACTGGNPGGSSQSPAGSPTGAPGTPAPSGGSAGLIFRAAYEGGFIAPNARRAQLPTVSVYADGRIMTGGMTPAIYPGPLVPSVVFRSVGADGAAAILQAARDAGLTGSDASYPSAPVPDAPTTVITVVHDGSRTVSRFDALEAGPGQSSAGSGPADRTRAAAATLLGGLMGTDTFGGTPAGEGMYQPLGFQLFVTPGSPAPSDPNLARPPVAWPLAAPLVTFGQADSLGGDGARIGVVVGADSATLRPILGAATQITPFTSGGKQWTLVVRPLLPDEVAELGGG
jgi:hypothetical protein